MSQILHAGENRVDRPSQIILGALNTDEWMFGEPLRDAAELGQNQQVFYRMDNHLLPAGLVEEKPREERPSGYEQARQFRLTERGADWVEDHAGEIDRPATREEIQQMVVEARDDAASAKASVQNYRKKLSRMKGYVEDLGDELAEMDRQYAHDYDRLDHFEELAQKSHHRAHDNERTIEELRLAVDDRATAEQFEEVRDDLATVEQESSERLGEVEGKLDETIQRQDNYIHERARFRHLLKPAVYLVVGTVVAYFIVLVALVVVAPELVASAVVGGICGILGVAIGIASAVYARGALTEL